MSFKFGSNSGSKVIVTPKIIVMGAGGAGCNAVNNMILSGLKGIYFIVANTDAQSLTTSLCENRIQLGASLTSGLGAGSSPEIGKKATEESLHEIEDYIKDANMLFIAAGMGGGTGTGATPIIAKLARDMNILTVGVVTKPFHFEQHRRLEIAEAGISELDKYCDTLIVISNQKLFGIANADTTFAEAFKIADNVLVSGVKCITNLITNPGIVNLDFADVKSVMSSLGRAIMGEGEASGENRAIKAAEAAITNPLLEHSSIVGASSILINITSGPDITLFEVNDIMQRITQELGNASISKFGSVIDPTMEGVIRVSIVATGIKNEDSEIQEDFSGHGNGKRNLNSSDFSIRSVGTPVANVSNHQNVAQVKKPIEKVPDPIPLKRPEHYAPQTNDFIKEYPQNVKHFQPKVEPRPAPQETNNIPNNTINFPLKAQKHEEIIFEDFSEENEESQNELESNSFFIPSAARRSHLKKEVIYNNNNNNGLFSKIFKKN
jgi:cell division protein FtsZ